MKKEVQKQEIKPSKIFSSHPNYNREKLGEILTEIISETSGSNISLRIEIENFNESSIKSKTIRVAVDRYDAGSSRIPVKIQLKGFFEKWILSVYLKKNMQEKASEFYDEFKTAARDFCDKEKAFVKQKKDSSKKKKGSKPVPSPDSKEVGVGKDSDPKPKKLKRQRASAVLTRNVIVGIIDVLVDEFNNDLIPQRKIWDLIPPGVTLGRNSILNYLEKEGFIKIIPQKMSPTLEVTTFALEMLEKHKDHLRIKKEEQVEKKEKEEVIKTLSDFPKWAFSSVKKLKKIQESYSQLQEQEVSEKELGKELVDLEKKVEEKQKELDAVRTRKEKIVKEIKRLASTIDSAKIANLVEITDRLVKQKID